MLAPQSVSSVPGLGLINFGPLLRRGRFIGYQSLALLDDLRLGWTVLVLVSFGFEGGLIERSHVGLSGRWRCLPNRLFLFLLSLDLLQLFQHRIPVLLLKLLQQVLRLVNQHFLNFLCICLFAQLSQLLDQ